MIRIVSALILFSSPFLASCSLVTVPVKTAGKIVETTIETTGKIVTAPFDRGGSKDSAEENSGEGER